MPSNSRKRLDENANDIDSLVNLYKVTADLYLNSKIELPEKWDVLFRSAIVLMVSHWEAYVEDICEEALDHIVTNISDHQKLPKELKKQVAKEIKNSLNENEAWELADHGWKNYVRKRMEYFRQERNRSFNTPKSENTKIFVMKILGIEEICECWAFDSKDSAIISKQLDALIEIRGEIAHRGRIGKKLDAKFITEQNAFLRKLASKTGGRINKHVKKVTGTPLF